MLLARLDDGDVERFTALQQTGGGRKTARTAANDALFGRMVKQVALVA